MKMPSTHNTKIIKWSLLALVVLVSVLGTGFVVQTFSQPAAQSRLLYDVFGKTFFSDVYVRFLDGSTERISPSTDGVFYEPHINSKGDKVVFFGNTSGCPRVWIADTKSGNAKALTPESSGARHAVFSWDGSMIAFASDRTFEQEREKIEYMRGNGLPPENLFLNLYIMDSDGRNVRQITHGRHQDQRPAFSPDGKTLAFVSNRHGSRQLWSVNIDGAHEPVALQKDGWGYRPWYSADGKWIFFFTEIQHRHQICKIPATGGEIIPLANDDRGTSHGPFADYDNETLLIHSKRDKEFEIWELPLNGAPLRKIVIDGFGYNAAHATRSMNGIIAFDVYRQAKIREILSEIKDLF